LAAATVMDGSALPAIDALASYDAISKAPRAAGYRGSDFVLWHSASGLRVMMSALPRKHTQGLRRV
jgi:hypothetical protein